MSGTAVVGNTFASAVTATGLQLDNNFSTVVAYLNDPTNRNNYAADAGTTNTVVTTFAPPVTGGYTTGLELTWKWAATNAGATVLNANGLGNISVVNPDGTALQAGQGKVGSIGKAVYDGTRAIFISASAQRPQEAKAWLQFNGTQTGTITSFAGFGISQVVKVGTGTYAFTLTTPFASATYGVQYTGLVPAGNPNSLSAISRTTVSCTIVVVNSAGAAADASDINLWFYGQQ